ncbi:1-deoxy-D-xylulose 5-phosphate reductoisomerase [Pseudarthrobacter chlorophenolicus A6]|uniref:1-deoxy-D-xylulose 5-phosphate reductoisomerase n=1 Tax=Pseudarthrobacter chlorophenolicus (strain ATCC 700700 / DSM 12829 / CIP 107037 / JCM 12360 / KCTC 9906 / NCIMB 13794 / A6) TaxID=452863 RepID=DXR_PSECP|nr:1-deoxy-D-xylulose-5-phosphate reductoisomerase [Pseudarthrobacter chlorophenolicus]B8HFR2.1 RecName: Full=1-deoxy-D-xylulose 5-phosphate reductoisomerase; Short=DXP reductoisomerase; AltName: Full=1-deoxyxylulose-5-phosphate reductoisomerase; AltName: Full=2-C-methyl-D-erythritol 4-phosphate synthase [Pseudarthrobacter chlorophenolicus A6]ACL39401.1 1-deoxy-D-xylulose 5-phosphate reductoisomerase [Pseudarthrobacter chlorophenolicus A6]SDQ99879.1 1-deoxy-D-xylulose 5-phosphate reductoisomeras
MQPRRIAILGSTGSIGTQAIDVVDGAPHLFEVVALSAGGGNLALLARQAVHTGAAAVGIAAGDPRELAVLIDEAAAAAGRSGYRPEIIAGPDASTRIAGLDADVVLNGITGSIGLAPTLAALKSGATLALANKESLIVGGSLVKAAARDGQIVPVDSEHSAIAQCLRSGSAAEVDKLVLTASGGPFRGRSGEELHGVTPQEALAHPTWDMGLMVTTNSATLVNKGLEVIEAHLLFDIPLDRIDVVVHPQSVVHSMVQFVDGSTIAQASPPDMRLPIALGLGWPGRVPNAAAPCDWTKAATWTFEPLDATAFPAVDLAKDAAKQGSTFPAVFNAANEEAVTAFHGGRIRFTDIVDTVDAVLSEHTGSSRLTVESVLDAESWARARAHERLAVSSL